MKRFLQAAAEADILQEVERYAELGLPEVALRFQASVIEAFNRIAAMPLAGAPRALSDPRLAGLRTWPVKGFNDFKVYYLVAADELTIVRVLHGRRDIGRLLSDLG